MISAMILLFGLGAWRRMGRGLLAFYAFTVSMIFASAMVAVLVRAAELAINPVEAMVLILVASLSQSALAVVIAASQAATLTLAAVLAKHAEEVDIDL